ncbi:MAG: hypothetical protein CMP68_04655 [Flavobacteriales bacterium]|nr:hypothetical protein [Flavobacteriales bacterium]
MNINMLPVNKEIINRLLVSCVYSFFFIVSSLSNNNINITIFLIFILITSLLEFFNITKKLKNFILKLLISTIFIVAPILIIYIIKTELNNGKNLLTFLFLIVSVNDVFAYLIGSKIGKIKAFKISPNKTIEGFLGGIIACVIIGPLLINFLNINLEINSFLLSLLISIFGICGDLLESYLKRKFNKKDSGTLLMSHGGVLDRVDSILFCAPILYIIIKLN